MLFKDVAVSSVHIPTNEETPPARWSAGVGGGRDHRTAVSLGPSLERVEYTKKAHLETLIIECLF